MVISNFNSPINSKYHTIEIFYEMHEDAIVLMSNVKEKILRLDDLKFLKALTPNSQNSSID